MFAGDKFMYTRFLVSVLAATCLSAQSLAQESLTGTISLRDAMEATLANHPRLRSFPLRSESLAGEREIANLRPPYQIQASLEDALGTGDLRDFTGAEVTFQLSNIVEMGGKRPARVGVVNRRLDVLDAEQRVLELDLLVEVVRRFIDVASAQARIELQEQATALAENTVVLLQPLVAAGQSPQLEVDRANAALLRAEIAEQAALASLDSARIRLANMWTSSSPLFNDVDSSLLAVGQIEPIDPLLAALDANPDIEIFAAESRLRDAEIVLAESRRQANVQWSAGIRHLKELDDTGFTFGVSIPLFNNSRASGAVRTALANQQEVEIRRLTALNAIEGEIRSLHRQLEQSIAAVSTLREEVIPALEGVQQQVLSAYSVGNYSYLDLISAQQEYFDAQLALIVNASNAHRLRAEIERLSGLALTGPQ
jgi:cobalt-zinc-cadmium efflux system outer membrane protein